MLDQHTRTFVAAWCAAVADPRTEAFDALVAADVRDLSGSPGSGRDGFLARARAGQQAFANIAVVAEDIVVQGDRIAWRWQLSGIHRGPFAGVAPSGHRVSFSGVNFQRLRAGRVIEHWTLVDVARLQVQLDAEGRGQALIHR